jgi:hypothetical protein
MNMELKQEFLAAWQSGMDYQTLLELVRRHRAAGMTQEDAYKTVAEIWQENGYADSTEDGPAQDKLAYVLEQIWYFG